MSMVSKRLWQNKKAVCITHNPNIGMHIRSLMNNLEWRVISITSDYHEAIHLIRTGEVSVAIVDDHIEVSSVEVLRCFLVDPITILTPTISLLMEHHSGESDVMKGIGEPEVTTHPFTPSKFLPSFQGLLKRWEKPAYMLLRNAANEIIRGNTATGLKLLVSLGGSVEVRHLVAQALAYYYRRLHDYRTAEKILLAALQNNPRDIGCILALSDLYLVAAMPEMAHKLLLRARAAFSNSLTMLPDLVQSCVMLGNIDEAIEYLMIMEKKDYMANATASCLAKLLASEGRESELDRINYRHKNMINRIRKSWAEFEMPPPSVPAAG